MSTEANKTLVRRFIEDVYNQGNLQVVDDLFGPDFTIPDVLPPVPPGPENIKQHVTAWRNAFPDIHVTLEDLIAEEDKVVYRWTVRGTHQGAFMGAPGTGRTVTTAGIVILRVANGRFVELWQSYDRLDFLRQLGLLPQSG